MNAVEQRTLALEKANVIRLRGAQRRREIAALTYDAGRFAVADVLDGTDESTPELEACRISLLLTAVDRIGVQKARTLLRTIDIRFSERRLDELTNRQRVTLAGILRASKHIAVKAAP